MRALCWAVLLAAVSVAQAAPPQDAPRWWKGNLHTHTLWSDGDDYPEVIAKWYKDCGYQFLALTDHNRLQTGERWMDVMKSKGGPPALAHYRKSWGEDWVTTRTVDGKLEARLKTLEEFRKRLEVPGKFLLLQGQEVTDQYKAFPVHINASNVQALIKPQGGSNVVDVMQRNVNAILAQRRQTGQPILPHLNHPNFGWGVTAEDLMQVKGERFFEVYNGHPSVHNEGDKTHASTERMWDIILTRRLAELKSEVLYGLATDDAHNYHSVSNKLSNPGRGWVMVRAAALKPAALIAALEAGDFYSSSGVQLRDVQRDGAALAIEIEAEPGVEYTTYFIGTRRGYDAANEPIRQPSGEALRVTHRYSDDIGRVLAKVVGPKATYRLSGDEIYVRAKVVSSKTMTNPLLPGEKQAAWIQPLVPARP
ncbi:MAG: hypothetical protein EXS28_00590 [Pedosphaera sp.]|nr:hypothetical protein [Pedosphaera sp.]